jgi:hypothetical protein
MLLHHHYAQCNVFFAHERERIQLVLFILLVMSTTARPSTLIEGCGYNDSLKYKDIEVFKVWDPDAPSEQVLLMRIDLRLYKGRRNKGLPYVSLSQRFPSLCRIAKPLFSVNETTSSVSA